MITMAIDMEIARRHCGSECVRKRLEMTVPAFRGSDAIATYERLRRGWCKRNTLRMKSRGTSRGSSPGPRRVSRRARLNFACLEFASGSRRAAHLVGAGGEIERAGCPKLCTL